MILPLIALLSGLAYGQTTPQDIKEPATNDTAEYLFQEVKRAKILSAAVGSDNTLTGANTFTGATTFTGAVTMTSSTTLNGVYSGGGIHSASSTTGGFGGTWTNTAYAACKTTVTITTTGNPVMVWFAGGVANTNASAITGLNFLVDGAFVSPWSSSLGIAEPVIPGANQNAATSFSFLVGALSAASHSFCLAAHVNAGTGSFIGSVGQFGVMEIK